LFDWDEANVGHMGIHSVQPHEAEEAVFDPHAVTRQAGVRGGEYREALIGMTRGARLLLVIIAERGDRVRVVTA
jgi:uncharacterized DUF497 family protein